MCQIPLVSQPVCGENIPFKSIGCTYGLLIRCEKSRNGCLTKRGCRGNRSLTEINRMWPGLVLHRESENEGIFKGEERKGGGEAVLI